MNECWECMNCALTRRGQICDEGRFYCFQYKHWKNASVLEEPCNRFYQKDCSNCINRWSDLCKETNGRFCPNYAHIDKANRFFMGRTYKPTNYFAIEAEKEFTEILKLRINRMKRNAVDKDSLRFEILDSEGKSYGEHGLQETLSFLHLTYRTLPRLIAEGGYYLSDEGIFYTARLLNEEYRIIRYVTRKGEKPRTRYMIVKDWDEYDTFKEMHGEV